MTREEFCHLMITLLEKTTGQGIDAYLASKGLPAKMPFADTNDAAIAVAYVLGVVNGTSATTFNPNGSITWQGPAAMLSRTATVLGLTAGSSENFVDVGQFASWAGESIAFVLALTDPTTDGKVMGGTGNGSFSPNGFYTLDQGILTALWLFHCTA